jgi:hypothetical protein
MYFAMFDEYDEGTAIMKAATDWSMIPTDYYFLTLSADGTWLSSDFYLRVAGAATAMLKSAETPLGTVSVPHSLGPVYYRNSFESRFTNWERNGVKGEGYQKLDPCFFKSSQIEKSNVSNAACKIEMGKSKSKSGEFYVEASGNPTSSGSAKYSYKISEVKIPVTDHLKLSFWKKTIDELGQFVSVDLLFKSGKKLSEIPDYKDNKGVAMSPGFARGTVGGDYEHFICEIGEGELLGDEITGIVIAYDKAASSGSYTAYIDDITLATNLSMFPTGIAEQKFQKENRIYVEHNVLNFKNFAQNTHVIICDIAGRAMRSFQLNTNRVSVNLPNGIYIVKTQSGNSVYSQKIVLRNL